MMQNFVGIFTNLSRIGIADEFLCGVRTLVTHRAVQRLLELSSPNHITQGESGIYSIQFIPVQVAIKSQFSVFKKA